MKRNIFIEHSVNQDTGEVTQKRWITKQSIKYNRFVKYYIDNLDFMDSLTNGQYRVLFELGKFCEYNTNKVYLDKQKRAILAKSCKMASVNQIISIFNRANILIKVSTSTFIMNPKILFNGEESERINLLEENSILFGIDKYFLQNK